MITLHTEGKPCLKLYINYVANKNKSQQRYIFMLWLYVEQVSHTLTHSVVYNHERLPQYCILSAISAIKIILLHCM